MMWAGLAQHKLKWFSLCFLRRYRVNRAFSSSLLCTIITRNHLPFFKILSNFVQFWPNFQIFCSFLPFFPLFFWENTCMPSLSRIGPGKCCHKLLHTYQIPSETYFNTAKQNIEQNITTKGEKKLTSVKPTVPTLAWQNYWLPSDRT